MLPGIGTPGYIIPVARRQTNRRATQQCQATMDIPIVVVKEHHCLGSIPITATNSMRTVPNSTLQV